MKTNILVSVIITTYNRDHLVQNAIQSVLDQTYKDLQIIIVNDCSTDDTQSKLSNYEFDNHDVIIVHNTSNLGLTRSLNKALKIAKGEIIARLDDDDVWINKNKIFKQLEKFQENPKLVLLGSAISDGKNIITNPLNDDEIRNQILFRCPFQHSSIMFKRKINGKRIFYNENLGYGEDWELWLRLGQLGEMSNLPDVTTKINLFQNMSTLFYENQHLVNYSMIKNYFFFYPKKKSAILYHSFVIFYFSFRFYKLKSHRLFKKVFGLFFKVLKN